MSEDATVRLIDCDSFQVIAPGARFLCEVGVEAFTPPELQGRSYVGLVQTPNHDAFRLAVMTFQLLFMGRHPFAGRYLGPGEMNLGRAIAEHRFAYSVTNRAMSMDRPRHAIISVGWPSYGRHVRIGILPVCASVGRPASQDWIDSLALLEKCLKRCAHNHSHWYPDHAAKCPWCEMEALGAKSLFTFVPPPGAYTDVEALWRQVTALPSLDPCHRSYLSK